MSLEAGGGGALTFDVFRPPPSESMIGGCFAGLARRHHHFFFFESRRTIKHNHTRWGPETPSTTFSLPWGLVRIPGAGPRPIPVTIVPMGRLRSEDCAIIKTARTVRPASLRNTCTTRPPTCPKAGAPAPGLPPVLPWSGKEGPLARQGLRRVVFPNRRHNAQRRLGHGCGPSKTENK